METLLDSTVDIEVHFWYLLLATLSSHSLLFTVTIHPVLSHSIQKRHGHSEQSPTKVMMMMPPRLWGLLPGELQKLFGHGSGHPALLGSRAPDQPSRDSLTL